MRTGSVMRFMGLCLSLAACTIRTGEPSAAEPNAPDAPSAPNPSGASNDPTDPGDPSDPADAPKPSSGSDAGADAQPAVDADAGSPPKHQIPVPAFGKLHAYASNNETCEFSANGIVKGTGTVLDVSLVTGIYTVACKRSDGVIASESATIVENTTTNVVFDFPAANGTLVAVAIDGTCAFSVNGAAKGTTSTLKLSLPPATYLVQCKPTAGGVTQSRTVDLKSGETAMAMFKL